MIRILFILSIPLIKAEYYIKDSHNPSFIYGKINEINKNHNQIDLKMTLNKMEGTLLYWLDKYRNQLIISLSDDINERIKIEFRNEENYLNLSELCGCLPCKYKLINLTITINGFVYIKCNQQPHKIFSHFDEIKINQVYPAIKTFDKFQAAIWLVNTPDHGEYYPNNAQLSGCIHEILFNNQTLNMTINGPEITNKCPITCTENVCNFGVCYETFDIDPICDCTDTFYNGKYCNSSGVDIENSNSINYPDKVQLKYIKITWQANSSHIFGIENKNISVIIQAEKNYIYILYEDKIELFQSNKTITDKYQPNQDARLYLSFGTKFIKLKFFQNNYTNIANTLVSKDLSKEPFTLLSAPKRSEFIDFVYKLSDREYRWRPLRVKILMKKGEVAIANVIMDNFGKKKISEMVSGTISVKDVFIGILSLLLGIFIITAVTFSIKFYKKKRLMENVEQDHLVSNNTINQSEKNEEDNTHLIA